MTILKSSKVKPTPTAITSGHHHRQANNVYKRNTGSRSWKRPQSETSSIPIGSKVKPATIRANNEPQSPTRLRVTNLTQNQPILSGKTLPVLRGGSIEPASQRSWKRSRDEGPFMVQPTTDATVEENTKTSYGASRIQAHVSGKSTQLRKVGHGKLVRVVKNPAVKRIQLSERVDASSDDNADGRNGYDVKEVTPIDDLIFTNTARLTDHAYRSHQGTTRSLVRVPINEAKTRICPTVFQRQRCIDPACRKRHDVAPECTIPICTFFQKPGLGCRSGDSCPFQHVKVNARTPVCPNFRRLGFCEEMSCTLLHLSK